MYMKDFMSDELKEALKRSEDMFKSLLDKSSITTKLDLSRLGGNLGLLAPIKIEFPKYEMPTIKTFDMPFALQDKLVAVSESFHSIFKDFDLERNIFEMEQDVKKFKKMMMSIGFPPHPDLDIRLMRHIVEEYDKEKILIGKNEIETIMCEYFDEISLKRISKKWESNPTLKARLPILRSAVRAHNLKMYEVSIPTLLPQFEGIIIDAFQINEYVKFDKIVKMVKILLEKDVENAFDFGEVINSLYRKDVMASFVRGKETTTNIDINRHAISHGANTNYAKEINSLKIILILDYIISVSSKITAEKIEKCRAVVYKQKS